MATELEFKQVSHLRALQSSIDKMKLHVYRMQNAIELTIKVFTSTIVQCCVILLLLIIVFAGRKLITIADCQTNPERSALIR